MRRLNTVFTLLLALVWVSPNVSAQEHSPGDTIRLSLEKGEGLLLQNSVLVMAEQLQIEQAKALKWQAEIWPNPHLEIDEVNLWATPKQLGYFEEALPPIWGSFGKNLQVSAALEQQLMTAGKRKKLIALEEVEVDQAESYFKDFIRGLKFSFRTLVSDLQFLQQSQSYHRSQLQSLTVLEQALQRQVQLGNVGKSDWIRLKAAQFELKRELLEIEKSLLEKNQEVTLLIGLPEQVYIVWEEDDLASKINLTQQISLGHILDSAQSDRPDLQMAKLDVTYFSQLERYESAQKVPDVNLKIGYDRGGNFMMDFIGFGASMDLPVFNRHQGSIRAAQLQRQRAELMQTYKANEVQKEITSSYLQLLEETGFLNEIEPEYEAELDQLLENYTANFAQRNISLLVFLDFLDAYMANKNTLLSSVKNFRENFEELQFLIGRDFHTPTL